MAAETPNTAEPEAASLSRRHRRIGTWAAMGALFMLMMAFASVPLYRIFCQVTGYGGTTQRAAKPSDIVLDRTIVVRFDSSVSPGLGWRVEPVQATQTVHFGETQMAYYRATNITVKPLVGTASFNVAPDQTGAFFNKLACFCFTEQRLEPGQTVDMPVQYFVDPAMATDKDAGHLGLITLSYTFFPVDHPKVSAAPLKPAGG